MNYYERVSPKIADDDLMRRYVDASLWCMSTITGSSFGDVTPETRAEKILALIMMPMGAIFFVKIFSDFVEILGLNQSEERETK